MTVSFEKILDEIAAADGQTVREVAYPAEEELRGVEFAILLQNLASQFLEGLRTGAAGGMVHPLAEDELAICGDFCFYTPACHLKNRLEAGKRVFVAACCRTVPAEPVLLRISDDTGAHGIEINVGPEQPVSQASL